LSFLSDSLDQVFGSHTGVGKSTVFAELALNACLSGRQRGQALKHQCKAQRRGTQRPVRDDLNLTINLTINDQPNDTINDQRST
jgi:hypothetical protein